MRKPLSNTHGGGGSFYSEGVNRQDFFGAEKCVRLARMSHHSHKLLQKNLGAVLGDRKEDLSEIWKESSGVWKRRTKNTLKDRIRLEKR